MWQTTIENHYSDVWNSKPSICNFNTGPLGQLPNGFAVLRFPPRDDRKLWTYATRCMSLPADDKPLELHVFSPWETDQVVEILVATAHFHRTSTKLDVGHSVNFGRPWIGKSDCDHGLISLPYLDGPRLEHLPVETGTVKFYWLIPVTASEVDFKKANGLEALEVELEKSAFDYVDPLRGSVV
jgi:hypothetical protein